jgi:hypothetical protein
MGANPDGDEDQSMNPLKHCLPAMAVCTMAVSLALGCGSGAKSSSAPEFVPTVNEICDRMDARVEAFGEPTSDEEYIQFLIHVSDVAEQGIGELRALTSPPAHQRDFRLMIAAVEAGLEATKQEIGAFEAGNRVAIRKAQSEFNESSKAFTRMAMQIGVDCGGASAA